MHSMAISLAFLDLVRRESCKGGGGGALLGRETEARQCLPMMRIFKGVGKWEVGGGRWVAVREYVGARNDIVLGRRGASQEEDIGRGLEKGGGGVWGVTLFGGRESLGPEGGGGGGTGVPCRV